MLEIVKDMCKAVLKDKKTVLVHCHAGYGRTGIVLACYMIFTSNKSAEAVVQEIRKVRSACVQKSSQMEYCKTFKDCKHISKIFFIHYISKFS
jgi:protein tyrosine phosphatase domain-containing protein 1